MQIAGKCAVVTGASSGIGAATARALADRGATVLLMARNATALEAMAAGMRAAGRPAHACPVDLADRYAVAGAVEAIRRQWGVPDIVVHSAGAGRWLFVDETSPVEMEQMMAVPYFGAFYLTRALLPEMIQRRSGHIVTVGSPATLLMWPGAAAYIAARWALQGFTGALRSDVYGLGIGVTLVVPGQVRSEYFAHNPGTAERVPKVIRLTATLTPDDVAAAVIRGIERNRRQIVTPFGLRLLSFAHGMFPGIGGWIGVLTGARRSPPITAEEDPCSCLR